jgi:hypothetical protein
LISSLALSMQWYHPIQCTVQWGLSILPQKMPCAEQKNCAARVKQQAVGFPDELANRSATRASIDTTHTRPAWAAGMLWYGNASNWIQKCNFLAGNCDSDRAKAISLVSADRCVLLSCVVCWHMDAAFPHVAVTFAGEYSCVTKLCHTGVGQKVHIRT